MSLLIFRAKPQKVSFNSNIERSIKNQRKFQKPQLYNLSWPEGRDAHKFGPGCVPVINDIGIPVSEDCLTLNVFRPRERVGTF